MSKKSLSFDFIITLATSFLIAITLVVLVHFIAKHYTEEELGLYLIVKRIVGFMSPFVLMGGAISIPKFIAECKDPQDERTYISASLFIVLAILGVLIIFSLLLPTYLMELFFNSYPDDSILIAVLIFLSGYTIKTIILGYYRGKLLMIKANLLGFISDSLLHVIVFIVGYKCGLSIERIIFFTGLSYYLYILYFFIFRFRLSLFPLHNLKKLFNYGYPRAIDGLCNQGLLLVGPMVVQFYFGLAEAGILVAGQILLRIMTTFFRPFGVVLLPRIAAMKDNFSFVKNKVVLIIEFILTLGVYASCALFVLTPYIVKYWLGDDYVEAISVMRVISFAIVPYLFFIMLKSVLDGYIDKPIVTKGLMASLFISAVMSLFFSIINADLYIVAFGSLIGFILIGFVVLYHCIRSFGLSRKLFFTNSPLFILSLVLWGITYMIVSFLNRNSFDSFLLISFIVIINFLVYTIMVVNSNIAWVKVIKTKLT